MSGKKVVSIGEKRSKQKEEPIKKQEDVKEEVTKSDDVVYCSFCGRPNTQVVKMVKGPGVNICSECTMIAVQYLILNDRMPSAEAQAILDAFWGKCK
ncbi:ClpX C4-type zinc finger protein [bacterium]|nr:ClpX C4-type zinc finger protein [bacterium]